MLMTDDFGKMKINIWRYENHNIAITFVLTLTLCHWHLKISFTRLKRIFMWLMDSQTLPFNIRNMIWTFILNLRMKSFTINKQINCSDMIQQIIVSLCDETENGNQWLPGAGAWCAAHHSSICNDLIIFQSVQLWLWLLWQNHRNISGTHEFKLTPESVRLKIGCVVTSTTPARQFWSKIGPGPIKHRYIVPPWWHSLHTRHCTCILKCEVQVWWMFHIIFVC